MDSWFVAAEQGDTDVILDWLKRGMDVDVRKDGDTTALMVAVRNVQIEVIKILLDHGASIGPENCIEFSALTYAILISKSWGYFWRNSCPDLRPLELLLAAGGRLGLREAILLNDVDLASSRLDEGFDVNTGAETYFGSVLQIAAEVGNLDVMNLRLDRGANIEETDDLGQTPLVGAAEFGQLEAVRLLLDRGANIEAVDSTTGQSALSLAASERHLDIVELLLAHGARRGIVDAVALDDEALTAEKLAQESNPASLSNGRIRLALLAARRGNLRIVGLLLEHGALHLEEWCDAHSLLAEATIHGHIDIMRLLIEQGADLHAVGKDGLTPLAWAIHEGQDAAAAILRELGATK